MAHKHAQQKQRQTQEVDLCSAAWSPFNTPADRRALCGQADAVLGSLVSLTVAGTHVQTAEAGVGVSAPRQAGATATEVLGSYHAWLTKGVTHKFDRVAWRWVYVAMEQKHQLRTQRGVLFLISPGPPHVCHVGRARSGPSETDLTATHGLLNCS